MRILQIGPISYVGGVSVHILRLSYLLKSQTNYYDIKFIDESPLIHAKKNEINIRRAKDYYKFITEIIKSDLIHIHSVHWLLRIFFILCAILLWKPFVVTLHSFRITGLKKAITLILLIKAKKVIAVSEEIKLMIHYKNIQTVIKEAFIPPNIEDELCLPEEIEKRIEIEKKDKILICANAFRLTPFNGRELYGLDQCIEVAAKLKLENLNILIIFAIGTIRKSDELYMSLKKKVEESELEKHLWIIPHQVPFVKLINHSLIVLRPTLSDGDAITIREAIHFKKIIIASDVVKRPIGTIIYKTGSSTDLYNKIVKCINGFTQLNESTSDNLMTYFNFYNNLYKICNN